MHGDDAPLDRLKKEMDALRREVQEVVGDFHRRLDGVCESNRDLHKRLTSLNTMLEERDQH